MDDITVAPFIIIFSNIDKGRKNPKFYSYLSKTRSFLANFSSKTVTFHRGI